jgi:hypothetical protein
MNKVRHAYELACRLERLRGLEDFMYDEFTQKTISIVDAVYRERRRMISVIKTQKELQRIRRDYGLDMKIMAMYSRRVNVESVLWQSMREKDFRDFHGEPGSLVEFRRYQPGLWVQFLRVYRRRLDLLRRSEPPRNIFKPPRHITMDYLYRIYGPQVRQED